MTGLRRLPRPLFLLAAATIASRAGAQDPIRPWRDWRTATTLNYRFHFPAELEQWTRHVAGRVESMDSALTALIGFRPQRAVHVVVDDPFGVSNGYAVPLLDLPATVWWALPPDPRNDIGNYGTWGELLAVHELAHLAHLTRPSRNPFQRRMWESLPANLGPIARRAPRWVFEGYATLIEGRVTGTGRPNNAWRPAILRQWAMEGQLPAYGQLNGSDAFGGGEFAYLGGSAFLEWLARREGGGDSSLVHVWRRMTARQVRTFDDAFRGVFGDAPAALYGRHLAELTADAMAARRELERAGLVEGELVQRLAWATGDPALSPNGERVALTLRQPTSPGRVVVWKTAPPPDDTAAIRRRVEALIKDPDDVLDRRFHPPARRADKTLPAINGRAFQQPRWFPDNRRVLVTRWTPRADGSASPDLYVWDTETGDVRKVTHGNGVLHGDPAPAGDHAVAMQCHWGHCDIARVDLERGVMTTLLEGNPEVTYYRPRYSPDGSRIAASMAEHGRWRVIVADRGGGNMSRVDPDDGANRYDAAWLGPDSLVVVSELGGIANLELIDLRTRETRTLTRVTGAAVAPDLNRADGSLWFLSLHARGYDLRTLARDGAVADSAIAIGADRFGHAGVRDTRGVIALRAGPVSPTRAYGLGPRHERWFPGAYASEEGVGGYITAFSGDIVGRLNAMATGAYGTHGTWQGGSLLATLRVLRPAIEIGAYGMLHEPSLATGAQLAADSLDVALVQSLLAVSGQRIGDRWLMRARAGGGAGRLAMERTAVSHARGLGFAELELQFRQQRGARGLLERVRAHVTHGDTRGRYTRTLGSVEVVTVGQQMMPLELGVTFGRITGSPAPFELFTVGGITSPLADSSLLSQRHAMPMLPTGIATGNALLAWRVALPSTTWTLFYEGASAVTASAAAPTDFARWHRAVGTEVRFAMPPVPVVFTPRLSARAGIAYTLDDPFRRKVRAYLSMRMEP
ncbi:MAG: hypothetical protein WD801_03820 [Gemmatimonadaceae bacterium]